MRVSEAVRILEEHNEWRRGAEIEMIAPAQIGIAIEQVTLAATRYETLRTLNLHEFSNLSRRNMLGENFDDMVDSLTKKMAKQ